MSAERVEMRRAPHSKCLAYPRAQATSSIATRNRHFDSARLGQGLPRTLRRQLMRKQPVVLLLDHRIALATARFQPGAIEHGDAAARISDDAGPLQLERALGHAFTAYAEH